MKLKWAYGSCVFRLDGHSGSTLRFTRLAGCGGESFKYMLMSATQSESDLGTSLKHHSNSVRPGLEGELPYLHGGGKETFIGGIAKRVTPGQGASSI